jgi:BirA family biotin operon repressor/biotin-[acetyl-CoA-carboxylase] ligase
MNEALDADLIARSLRGRFGSPLRYYPSIGSTNEEAMTWADEGAPEGAVVGADHQTAGRGRWGRTWSSEPGNLVQTSTILRPNLPVLDAGVITTSIGVACARAVEEVSGLEVGLKWPNDVNIAGKKIAGILVESRVDDRGNITVSIAGVGINANWAIADMPEEIRERATSISVATRAPVDRLELLVAYLHALESVYGLIKSARRDEVIVEAVMRSEILERDVTVRFLDGSTIAGRATGIDPSGALKLETAKGLMLVHVGEIEQLRPI